MTQSAIYLRLSRESDDSASLATQRAACHRWLLANGHDPADATEYVDTNISGAKPIEDRPGLRALMTARPAVVITWKLDRFARSVAEFLRLVAWAESAGIRLATTDNTVNTTTPTGRMVATVLASLAEWERSMISTRITEGHATRRTQGRWASGRPPFGYRIVRRDGAAFLEIDESQAELVRSAVAELVAGGTVASTARTTGLSEPQWRRLLKSPTLRGQRAHKGTLVVAADGVTPVNFAEPILSAAELLAVRRRMLDLATGADRAPRKAAPMCSKMGECYRCAGRLTGGTSDKGTALYRCKAGHVTIYAETLDQRVEAEFLKIWGGFAEVSVRLEGGNDLSAEMIEAQEQAARIGAQMATAGPLMLGTYEEMSAKLEAAYAALLAAHDPEVREVQVPTGRTMGAAWEALDAVGRGRLLVGMGLRVVLHPKQRDDRLEITWGQSGQHPEDVRGDEIMGELGLGGEA
ncbi:recombinase family protein [Streptomyces sp. ADI93-02]|uniref:recombinase family protein n=1 Tax=Streptomyces sp. ADI93-02 TaxID=1522757 RepID=UPI000F557DB3|nr:recombinase family protein [Streptomyces sp. ADI93-02]RPK50821.1 DNA-invertase hin [Streptomyces sp. ADI93-02]